MYWLLPELIVLLCALAAFVTALELGYRLGMHRQVRSDEPDKTHANALHGAVTFLSFAVSMAALGLVSYSCGLSGRRRPLVNLRFAFLIALVLVIILDIDRPRRGFVQTHLIPAP